MAFFAARRVPPEPPRPDPRGWLAYVPSGPDLTDETPVRVATDVELADTHRARIWIATVDGYTEALTFDVRCELRDVRGGEALQELLTAGRSEPDGAAPPRTGLLVGLELADGTRVRTYAVGPHDPAPRLLPRSGGASAGPGRPSTTHAIYALPFVPDRPFRVVCSFTAVGIDDAEAVVDPRSARPGPV
jgi:hypothetical protein